MDQLQYMVLDFIPPGEPKLADAKLRFCLAAKFWTPTKHRAGTVMSTLELEAQGRTCDRIVGESSRRLPFQTVTAMMHMCFSIITVREDPVLLQIVLATLQVITLKQLSPAHWYHI